MIADNQTRLTNALRTALRGLEDAMFLSDNAALSTNIGDVRKELYVIWRDVTQGGYVNDEVKRV